MKMLKLSNPDGKLVRSAHLTELENGTWWLCAETKYRRACDGFLTERQAKNHMGRNYQKGCKWVESLE